ncbi:MAG: peptidylprolyl isomerase [Pseudomonadota bacterium]
MRIIDRRNHDNDQKAQNVRIFKLIPLVLAAAIGIPALAVAQTTAAPSAETRDPKAIVARVNGVEITEQDMILAEQEIGSQIQRMPPSQRRRVLVEFLVENQLVADAAKSANLASDAGFKARMDYWRRRSLRDTYFEANIESSVDDKAAKAFYDQEVAKRSGGEEVRASHILVKTEEKANEIFEALAHDGDFAELAQKNSIDPGTKAKGGDLGFFGKGRMVPAFDKAAFALKEGEVSEPVKSQFGWHVIKVTEKRTQQPPPFAQLKDRIKLILVRRRATEIIDGYRAKAEIDYVDPAVKALVEQSRARQPSPGDTPAPKQ